MEATELLKKVRKIEIKSKGLSRNVFAGEYHSAFKGRGMTFSEVREYQYGDDVRNIDWKVTARFNHPYIKIFQEERELTVMLIVDVSASNFFGSKHQTKKELITELAAVISFSAIQNNDKVGLILFSNKIEKFIAPQSGKKHILLIIRELLNFTPQNTTTNVECSLKFLSNVIKKRSTTFIISDFITPDFSNSIKIAKNKHDIVALRINDPMEAELPKMGLIKFMDLESGNYKWINTSNNKTRLKYKQWYNNFHNKNNEIFNKYEIDNAIISTNQDFVKPLIKLFKSR